LPVDWFWLQAKSVRKSAGNKINFKIFIDLIGILKPQIITDEFTGITAIVSDI
jgi:hypothetical protein